jgi:tight adherence protein B
MSGQLVTILVAVMAFGAVIMVVFGAQAARSRASTPEMENRLERYGHITDAPAASASGKQRPGAAMSGKLDSAVKDKSFASNILTQLARADLRITVGEFLLLRMGAALGGALIGAFLGRSGVALMIVFAIMLGAIGSMAPVFVISMRAKSRQKKFVGQLGDTIGLMANSMRAGYSLLQTMELIAKESPAPMADEFRRVVREVGLGISPQAALNNLLRRIPSEDLDLMVSAINIQHEIGGNLGQILDIIGETIRERVRIQGEIGVLVAQQEISGYVITAMPVVMAGILFLINPEYISQILVWPWICMPIAAIGLLVAGFFAMRKISAIEV